MSFNGKEKHRYYNASSRRSTGSLSVKLAIGSLCCLVVVGIFFAAYLTPGNELSGPVVSSIFPAAAAGHDFLIDSTLAIHDNPHIEVPDWSSEFWTPIDIDISNDPMIVLCKLNFKQHWMEPHNSPMFKDLVGISSCIGNNRRRERMSVLLQEIRTLNGTPQGRVVEPTGFVFHESRVGSTLVANMLATDPFALVFSESTPFANAILHCDFCAKQKKLQLFRDVATLMGRSPIHKRMYIKFQSITSTRMEIALEAFPETTWAFIFRQPVQTMMSHLDPRKGGGSAAAPCLRSKRSPPKEVTNALSEVSLSSTKATNDAWCAAHLKMLCNSALQAYQIYNTTTGNLSARQRGLLINYESLPGIVPKALLPLFGQSIDDASLKKMHEESQPYSKSRGMKRDRAFTGDSEDKDLHATETIKKYAELILQPTYNTINVLAIQSFKSVYSGNISQNDDLWASVKEFPATTSRLLSPESRDRSHSSVLAAEEFFPWKPFSNHHTSKPFRRPHCPMEPPQSYPEAYKMMDMVTNWNTDSNEIPPFHYDSLCHFDYQNKTQLAQAYAYRNKEVPFVVYNVPEIDEVVKKWNDMRYLSKLLGNKLYRTETSKDNHFMYWSGGRRSALRNWKPPTEVISTTFRNWLEVAVTGQNMTLENRKHEYFRVSSDMNNEWLYEELPFFKPKKSLLIVEPREQRGIHCRFGMRSVIAEAHFDGSRNSVVMLGGLRRWILAHPDQCKNLHMLQRPHPSARHSAVDWSKPDLQKYPNFAKLMGNEVILQPGDMLFVPTVWIHYIISLNINFQCNTRSGVYHGYDRHMRDCGF